MNELIIALVKSYGPMAVLCALIVVLAMEIRALRREIKFINEILKEEIGSVSERVKGVEARLSNGIYNTLSSILQDVARIKGTCEARAEACKRST